MMYESEFFFSYVPSSGIAAVLGFTYFFLIPVLIADLYSMFPIKNIIGVI